jgi:hypothetical protein
MSNEEVIQDFIVFNESIFNQIREEDEQLSNALSEVVKELFGKFVGIDIITATDNKDSLYKVGEEVATISGDWEGVAVIKKVGFAKDIQSYMYILEKDGETYKEEEANLYSLAASGDTNYANMTLEQLQNELEIQKELLEIFDDPNDQENIQANDALLAIELEIENRQ